MDKIVKYKFYPENKKLFNLINKISRMYNDATMQRDIEHLA